MRKTKVYVDTRQDKTAKAAENAIIKVLLSEQELVITLDSYTTYATRLLSHRQIQVVTQREGTRMVYQT